MQKHNAVKASINRGDHLVNVKLHILTFEEYNLHYVYSPALDLTGAPFTLLAIFNLYLKLWPRP